MRLGLAAALALFASACATLPISGPGAGAPPSIPSGPLSLGDYRNGSPGAVLSGFEREITSRYAPGVLLAAAATDLRAQQFTCAAPSRASRGDPPAQICRRTLTANGCTYTWQAHLFAGEADRVGRARGLYDRRCGGDGLLGGPG